MSAAVTVRAALGAGADTTYGSGDFGDGDFGYVRPWVDLSPWTTEVLFRRGRARRRSRVATGTLEARLVSPVALALAADPGGQAVIAEVAPGLDFAGVPTWTGTVATVDATLDGTAGALAWELVALDALGALGRTSFPTGDYARPAESLEDRARAIAELGRVPWRERPGFEVPNHWVQSTEMWQPLAQELGIAADTWRFAAWVDGAGALGLEWPRQSGMFAPVALIGPPPAAGWPRRTLKPRDRRYLGDAVAAVVGVDVADATNDVTFANAGGTARNATDPDSIRDYGHLTYQRLDLVGANGPVLGAAAAVDGWIADLLGSNNRPQLRVSSITLELTEPLAEWLEPGPVPFMPVGEALARLGLDWHVDAVLSPVLEGPEGPVVLATADPIQARPSNHVLGLEWSVTATTATLTLFLDAPVVFVPWEVP